MKTKSRILIGAGAVLLILAALIFAIPREITLVINGQGQSILTRAWTVENVLEKGGLETQPEDVFTPHPDVFLLGVDEIQVDLAREVVITSLPAGQETTLISAERDLPDLLSQAGVSAAPEDSIIVNNEEVDPDETLDYSGAYFIELKKAVAITVTEGESTRTIQSSADSVGQALAEEGIPLGKHDRLSLPPETPLDGNLAVTIHRARTVTIRMLDKTITVESAGLTAGEALADAGISLQGLDYSIPADDSPLPADLSIQVVRVREEINQTQTSIPFSTEYIQSDEVELDKTDVVTAGEFGIEVTRTRVRYEDGLETSRTEEVTWVAKQPVTQKVGRGTQVVVRKMDTPHGEIEYWRTVNVYVTSYSPCRSGADRCYYGTSSGLPVQQGVVGVTRAWYNLMVGQRIYVPNYGIATIADVGGGVPGQYWIDVGYTDDAYVAWHSNVTIYFLTPVPANIPWILP